MSRRKRHRRQQWELEPPQVTEAFEAVDQIETRDKKPADDVDQFYADARAVALQRISDALR